jgi:uncharacterized protein (TIGR02246 family)
VSCSSGFALESVFIVNAFWASVRTVRRSADSASRVTRWRSISTHNQPRNQRVNTTGLRTVLAVAMILAAGCAHAGAGAAPGDARELLDRRDAAFRAAAADRDTERLAGFFAEDATLHVAGMPAVRGREAIGRFYENVHRFLAATTSTPESHRIATSADLAYSTGSTTNEFRSPEGTTSYAGKYATVWVWRDGNWFVSLHSVSSDRSDPGR